MAEMKERMDAEFTAEVQKWEKLLGQKDEGVQKKQNDLKLQIADLMQLVADRDKSLVGAEAHLRRLRLTTLPPPYFPLIAACRPLLTPS
eukprot:6795969-Pyramimonas_sp.AAC.1